MKGDNNKNGKLPILAGLGIALVFFVLTATGMLPKIVSGLSSFFASGPTVGPVMWGVIGIVGLGAYYLYQQKREK